MACGDIPANILEVLDGYDREARQNAQAESAPKVCCTYGVLWKLT